VYMSCKWSPHAHRATARIRRRVSTSMQGPRSEMHPAVSNLDWDGGWAKKKQRLVDTFSKESDGASHTSYWWPLGPGTSCGRITFWRIELIKWLCRGIFSFPITCSIASTYSALAIFWDKNLLKMLKQCIVLSGPTLFCKSALIFRVSILPLCVAFSEALHL
jgi:hypothetical protein